MLWSLQYVYYSMLYENKKMGLAKRNPYISHWKLLLILETTILLFWTGNPHKNQCDSPFYL